MERQRILILGAAGRDFHNFNVAYRENSGTKTDNGDGTYSYVFDVNLMAVTGVTYDATLTHRVSVMIHWASTLRFPLPSRTARSTKTVLCSILIIGPSSRGSVPRSCRSPSSPMRPATAIPATCRPSGTPSSLAT